MISNKYLYSHLESWVLSKIPNGYRASWIDVSKLEGPKLDCKYYDAYEEDQSFILKNICENNNISYEIYIMKSFVSDHERIQELIKFLDWKSKNYSTILFSKNLKEQLYFGEYKKYGKDILDFYPFAEINKSQLDALVNYLKIGEDIISLPINSLLEWMYKQDLQFKIISSEDNPTKNIRWATYNLEQRSIIAKFYALVKERKHKIIRDNYFNLPKNNER
jgi:hypothetical protein